MLSVILLFGCVSQTSHVNVSDSQAVNPAPQNNPAPTNVAQNVTNPSQIAPAPMVNPPQNTPPPSNPSVITPPPPVNNPPQVNNPTPAPSPPPQPPALVSSLASSQIIYYSTGWNISGTLYPSTTVPMKLIILVPALDKTRDCYPQYFIQKLHDQIPDAAVLAIDSRGNGKSNDLGSWHSFDSFAFKDMKTDVLSAKTYFVEKYPTLKEYYVVGADMGSTAAILAGVQENLIVKIVMLSPGMSYENVSIQQPLYDYHHALLAVATSGDSYPAQSVSSIQNLRNIPETSVKIYDGSADGADMFDSTQTSSTPLSDLIVNFLKN